MVIGIVVVIIIECCSMLCFFRWLVVLICRLLVCMVKLCYSMLLIFWLWKLLVVLFSVCFGVVWFCVRILLCSELIWQVMLLGIFSCFVFRCVVWLFVGCGCGNCWSRLVIICVEVVRCWLKECIICLCRLQSIQVVVSDQSRMKVELRIRVRCRCRFMCCFCCCVLV